MKKAIIILLLVPGFLVTKATDWTLKKEDGNIKIYTASNNNTTIKVESVVDATSTQVIAAFFDFERRKQWIYGNKSSKLLKKINDTEFVYYSEMSIPWPYSNRDFVAQVKISRTSPGVVVIDSHSEPEYIPEKDGLVRIKHSTAQMVLTSLGNNTTKIEYVIQLDTGGDIPGWLTNMCSTKGPYETFEKLPERLKYYQNTHYALIN
jgi:hypothetical protein